MLYRLWLIEFLNKIWPKDDYIRRSRRSAIVPWPLLRTLPSMLTRQVFWVLIISFIFNYFGFVVMLCVCNVVGIASTYPEPEDKEAFIKAQLYDFNYDNKSALPELYEWPNLSKY